jgi:DNA-binding GntR family transcriptional regulator
MKTDFEVNMNEYLPLRDVVFNTLRQAILKGELKPGERLMEIQLANRLGVSRTPIREAIRKLELEGLVLMIPRKGAEVAKITVKNLRDVLEVRRALEELAVQVACEHITDEQLQEINQAAAEFEKAVKNKELSNLTESDIKFHDLIFQSTTNQKLIVILHNLREQMYRYRVEYLKDSKSHIQLIREHADIINALERRDKEAATLAIRTHIENQEKTVISNIEETTQQ